MWLEYEDVYEEDIIRKREDLIKLYEEEIQELLEEVDDPERLESLLWKDFPEWAYEKLEEERMNRLESYLEI